MCRGSLGRPIGGRSTWPISAIIVADQTLRSVRDTVRLRAAFGEGDAAHRNLLVVNRNGEGGRHAMTLDEMGKVNRAAENRNPVSAEVVHR